MMETNFTLKSGSVTDRGLNERRPQNEDSFADLPQIGLFAVADGVGGASAGEVASQMAIEIISEAFANLRSGGDAEELMRTAVQQANAAIFQMSSDIPQLSTMATTVVALHIGGNIATIAHVGDSRLYRVDEKGNLYRETRDHSVVEEEVRAGRLTPEQAANHPSRNVISRALGAEAAVEVDMKSIMFAQGTSFLLCSDGITRHITDLEISQLLMSPLEPDEICQTMKSLCFERGAEDNLTAVVVRCGTRQGSATLSPTDLEEVRHEVAPQLSEPVPVAVPVGRDELPVFEETEPQTIDVGFNQIPNQLSYSIEEQDRQIAEAGGAPETQELRMPFEAIQQPRGVVHTKRSADELDLLVYQGGVDAEAGSGGGSILRSVIFLLLGIAIGAGAFYGAQQYLLPKVPEIKPLTEVQTPNIAYTAFEDSRRAVDANPEQFIKSMEGKAEDAEDNYLLARAYIHKNKVEEAKICLTNAKNQLKDAPVDQQKMLAAEIAILSSVAADEAAVKRFQGFIAALMAPKAADANVNANVNAKVPSNVKPAGNVNAARKPGNTK